MAYRYKNRNYWDAIQEYKSGNRRAVDTELSFLVRGNVPEFEEDAFHFISDVSALALEKADRRVIAKCTELAEQMRMNGDSGFAYTYVVGESLQTEHDCIVALKNCLDNGMYQSVLTNIVEFVRGERNFHTAYAALKVIDDAHISNKLDVALYFIERMQEVIDEEIRPQSIIGLHYTSKYWTRKQFKNDDYVHYQDLVLKFRRSAKAGQKKSK